MKNASPSELIALRARARDIARALTPPERSPDGRLLQHSREALQKQIDAVLRCHRAVGASIVLCAPGGAADFFHYGYARLRPKIPVTAQTCFRIASVSKLVMSFAALSLCESGQLDIDRDISDYLGYRVCHPRAGGTPVTMRMLLTHTAGVTDAGPYGTRGMQPGCTLRELLESPASWLHTVPGEAFHYSNLGAGAAGVVLERAAGMPFDDILQQRVFSVLGVRASYDPRRIIPAGDLADGYSVRSILPPRLRYDAAQLSARPPEPFDPERDYLIAAGRMITDSCGMERLIRLLASKDGMGVISAASLDMMRAPQDGACGIQSAGRGLNTAFLPDVFPGFSPVGHQGVAYGMCAELFADPKTGAGVGVMTSGVRLARQAPLMRAGFDLLALGFASLAGSG
ncbi:MAG: beta-lactamase family protein [Clostridia bacterium]|nr:beta-lactamase family protein [Clostridia bacterium]